MTFFKTFDKFFKPDCYKLYQHKDVDGLLGALRYRSGDEEASGKIRRDALTNLTSEKIFSIDPVKIVGSILEHAVGEPADVRSRYLRSLRKMYESYKLFPGKEVQGQDKAVRDFLRSALADPSEVKQYMAASVLTAMRDASGIPILAGLIPDMSTSWRKEILDDLRGIEDPAVIKLLVVYLQNGLNTDLYFDHLRFRSGFPDFYRSMEHMIQHEIETNTSVPVETYIKLYKLFRPVDNFLVQSLTGDLATGDSIRKQRVIEALGLIGDPDAEYLLREALADPDPVIRIKAENALKGTSKEKILALLDKRDFSSLKAKGEYAVDCLLESWKSESSSPDTIRVFFDPETRPTKIIEFFELTGDPKGREIIARARSVYEHPTLEQLLFMFRQEQYTRIARLDASNIRMLIEHFFSTADRIDLDSCKRLALLHVLIPTPLIDMIFIKIITKPFPEGFTISEPPEIYPEPYEEIRVEAVRALGNSQNSGAVDVLVDFMKNPNRHIYNQAEAAQALGKIGDNRAVGPLISMLSEFYVCDSAAIALCAIGDETVKAPLRAYYQEKKMFLNDADLTGQALREVEKFLISCGTTRAQPDGETSAEHPERGLKHGLHPETAQKLYDFVNDQDQSVTIIKNCQTPDQTRSGFTKVAYLMQKHPGQEKLVQSLLVAGSPDGLDDNQVFQLRQTMIDTFTVQSRSMRQSLKNDGY